jgi:hypothetical protein
VSLSIKPGVVLAGLRPEMAVAAQVVADVYREHGVDCVITSAVDGQHSQTSLHYAGAALDFRTRTLSFDQQFSMLNAVIERLGKDFDVVLESDHLHVEHQPRRGGGVA